MSTSPEQGASHSGFQRIGAISNAHVGRDFEAVAARVLNRAGIATKGSLTVDVGVANVKKPRTFDLGNASPPVIVECKSHKWTAGGNIPSAKLTVWNEAMYYFAIAPPEYRKILFVLRDHSAGRAMTLAEYYKVHFAHLIPPGVEIWEYDDVRDVVGIL